MRAVSDADTHTPESGQTGNIFEKIHKKLMHLLTFVIFKYMQKPVVKTCNDPFRRFVELRREENKRIAAASGIVEKLSKKADLLDDIIEVIDMKAEDTCF